MTPKWCLVPKEYFDVEVRGASSSGGGRIPALPVVTRLVSILHGIFREYPGRFALAFPRMQTGEHRHPGHVVRLFASSRDDLDIVHKALEENDRIAKYVRTGYPKKVPDDFNGPWVEFRRYRIPGNGSRLLQCRSYRLKAGENLPFLRLMSKGNRNVFSFHIERREGKRPATCQPDSYGFSVPSRAFALPELK